MGARPSDFSFQVLRQRCGWGPLPRMDEFINWWYELVEVLRLSRPVDPARLIRHASMWVASFSDRAANLDGMHALQVLARLGGIVARQSHMLLGRCPPRPDMNWNQCESMRNTWSKSNRTSMRVDENHRKLINAKGNEMKILESLWNIGNHR